MPEQITAISGGPGWHITPAGAGFVSILGSVETFGGAVAGSYTIITGSPNYSLPIIGSVYATIGSSVVVNVDVNVSDYVSIVGSPNYNLPISNKAYSAGLFGSAWITTSSTNIMQPRTGRQGFGLVPTGSLSSTNSGKIWAGFGSSAVMQGFELVQNQPWGLDYYEGSVSAITDAGSICVSFNE